MFAFEISSHLDWYEIAEANFMYNRIQVIVGSRDAGVCVGAAVCVGDAQPESPCTSHNSHSRLETARRSSARARACACVCMCVCVYACVCARACVCTGLRSGRCPFSYAASMRIRRMVR